MGRPICYLKALQLGRPRFNIRKIIMFAWVALLVAGLFEVVWAYTMKLSNGFTSLYYSSITIVAMIISFGLLAFAMKSLPLGTAYMIWTGVGAIGAFVVGIMILGEPMTFLRILAATLIFSGLILMKMAS